MISLYHYLVQNTQVWHCPQDAEVKMSLYTCISLEENVKTTFLLSHSQCFGGKRTANIRIINLLQCNVDIT